VNCKNRRVKFNGISLHSKQMLPGSDNPHNYRQGEVTSPNLWSRYDRRVVGITWHDVWS